MTREFARWLQDQMDKREWGVTRLAREIGVSHGLVSQWLRGERNPSPASLDKIADKLVADLDTLLLLAGHRDSGGDPRSDAVRRLQPLIDQIEWTEGMYRLAERYLESLRDMQRSTFKAKTASWDMEDTEDIKITEFGEDEEG